MNVPVFAGRHIVLVAGVGNKDFDYDFYPELDDQYKRIIRG